MTQTSSKMNPKESYSEIFIRNLKKFDIYAKIQEEYRVKTSVGATLSIFGWVVIAVLVISELSAYSARSTHVKQHMVVDTTLRSPLKINLDVTFHALRCSETHMDNMDVAGDNQLNVEHDMYKQRLSSTGKPIGKKGVEIIGQGDEDANLPKDYCGSCYGAAADGQTCCNTCSELIRLYNTKGWSTTEIVRSSEQCIRDKNNPFTMARQGEGCRLTGSMEVNKVAGNFHIAFGQSIVQDGRHIHQFVPTEAGTFNISHTIHSISFGEVYPGMAANPLDGTVRMLHESTGLFQYYIKVIPTHYKDSSGNILRTNQYTFTERFRPFALPDASGNVAPDSSVLPGIFFVYDLAPFMMEVTTQSYPLSHLFTRLCAVVGGVFTLLGVLDAFIYSAEKASPPQAHKYGID